MHHGKHRFGLSLEDPQNPQLYDYVGGQYLKPEGLLVDEKRGQWDLAVVAQCIAQERGIESAFTPQHFFDHQAATEAACAARDAEIARLNDVLSIARQKISSLELALSGSLPKSGTSESRPLLDDTKAIFNDPASGRPLVEKIYSLDELLAPQEAPPPAKPEG